MMKHLCYLALFIFAHINVLAQIKGSIKDSISGEPVPFVNIWVENTNLGTTSNEHGAFELIIKGNKKPLVFSAVGYETKKVYIAEPINNVLLKPEITLMEEVTVKPTRKRTVRISEKVKKIQINNYFVGSSYPYRVARYFAYDSAFNQTPFLGKLIILTNSEKDDAELNLIFFLPDKSGAPGSFLYDKPVRVILKKGTKKVEVDLSALQITLPEEGIFIAVEWLIINKNRYTFEYTETTTQKKKVAVRYTPSIGSALKETNKNSWIYSMGAWRKMFETDNPLNKKNTGKYMELAMELWLVN